MKNILLTIFTLATVMVYGQDKDNFVCKNHWFKNTEKSSPNVNSEQIEQMKKYDINFYKLDFNMSNESATFSGIVEVHAFATQEIDSALLEFHHNYTIHSIKVNNGSVAFSQYDELLSVPINLSTGEHFIITVDYEGTAPSENALFGVSGLNNQTSNYFGQTVTYSLSEPFGAYEWFPCKQELKDKADSVQVNITVPDHLMAGSNGVLDSVTVEGGFKTFHWMHRHPIAYYLISVAVGNYRDYSFYAYPEGTDSVLIQNFLYDDDTYVNFFLNNINKTGDYLEFFSEIYGLYPFANEKYGHSSAPFGGGMEHQTMTSQDMFTPTLVAHELAHQWFGNNVTCSSWADIWMNEGFAAYSEFLMLYYLNSFEDGQDFMEGKHTSAMSQPGGSTWVVDSLDGVSIFDSRLVYEKGGAIIHTLRYIIDNDDLFFDILKDYQQDFAGGSMSGLGFKDYLEQKTNLDLNDFFEQWYFGEGYPTYSLEYHKDGDKLYVLVNQETSTAVTPLFTNPLDIQIARTNGLEDTIVRINITSNQTLVSILDMAEFDEIVAIDPLNFVINKEGTITENQSLSVQTELIEEKAVVLYPNPTLDKFSVRFEGEDKMRVKVYNQKGQLIIDKTVQSDEPIDMSTYSNGQYLIDVSNDKGNVTRKVIKM